MTVPRQLSGPSLRAILTAAAVLVGLLLTGLGWVLASPIGSSPDDDFHQTSIWCLTAGSGSACETRYMIDGTPAVKTYAALQKPCFATHIGRSAGCQELTDDLLFTDRVNAGTYPSGYYSTMHLLAGDHVVWSVLAIRAANFGAFVGLSGLVWWLASRRVRTAMTLTLATAIVPLGLFLLASVNPSAWGVTGISVQFFGILALADAVGRWRPIALAALITIGAAMASASRGDAGAYAVAVSVIGGWLIWPALRVRPWRALALVLPVVLGLRSFLGAGQTRAYGESTFTADALVLNLMEVVKLPLGNFGLGSQGSLGWLDTPMPAVTWGGLALVLGVIVVPGLASCDWRRLLAAVGTAVLLIALPMYMLQLYGYRVGEFVQPRYLLPLVVVGIGIVAWPRGDRPRWWSKRTAVIVGVLLAVAHGAGLYTNLVRYVNGSWAKPLGSDTQWWWNFGPGPLAVWGLGTFGFALFLAAAFSYTLSVRRTVPAARTEAR